ncbi:MAG: ABC transporter permease [Proteobacteria bacterium]|nr:ABC transporter permease [Pseudomonadota bacterium]
MSVHAERNTDGLLLTLDGEWSIRSFESCAADLGAVNLAGVRRLTVDARGAAIQDLSGAWALERFLRAAANAGIATDFRGEPPAPLKLVRSTLEQAVAAPPASPVAVAGPGAGLLAAVGRRTMHAWADLVEGVDFFGRVMTTLARGLARPRHLRPISISRHIHDTGVTAIGIVSLIAFLISVILAYMGAEELRGLGADIYVADLVTVGVLRELGVLLTAIIIAGRSGSAFAAELGSMRINEEVDALTATGVDPVEVLVVPRVLGLAIALPLLTVIADLVGIAGGGLLCRVLLDMPLSQYLGRVDAAISGTTFWVGVAKAPVFALLIALAGCYRGLQVRGSARELGRLVTVAVVQAIFFVILVDALFAVLFMKMDI